MKPNSQSLSRPSNSNRAVANSGVYDLSVPLPYSLLEADAVFHNVTLETVLRRYYAATLREVGHAQ